MAIFRLAIGTRGSELALKQTQLVINALQALDSRLHITTKIITTKGDKNLSPIPLDTVGKAWFTAEIEEALQSGAIDVAVHSLKDLPPTLPNGLLAAPVLSRDDPRDVLIAKAHSSLADLPRGAVVGTDSIRRKVLLLKQRPDLVVRSVRGNIGTRLQKLYEQDYDALVLAAAGLSRLGMLDKVTEFFEPQQFIPAAGQGVLAAEALQNREELWEILSQLQDSDTVVAVAAEQKFTNTVDGGCKLPVGCYAQVTATDVTLHGVLGNAEDDTCRIASVNGPKDQAVQLAEALARTLLSGEKPTTANG